MTDIEQVIKTGICVGCGGCAALYPQDFAIERDGMGRFAARRISAHVPDGASAICPMSGAGADEDALAAALFPDLPADPRIGRYGYVGLGWVAEGSYRARGSSGGILTWAAARLLETGQADEVVQVAPTDPETGGEMFSYRVARTADEVRAAAKTRYYAIQARDALSHVRSSGKRTVFVGLPCFVKAVRLAMAADPALAAHIKYTLGLICGHLKSDRFAELLAWQAGVPPADLAQIDFRDKIPGRDASRYGIAVARRSAPNADPVRRPMEGLAGQDWGQGLMKYRACDYCDDVVAECADLSVGDAWLPGWRDDWQGTNVLIARHPDLIALIAEGRASGALDLTDSTADEAALSQAAGLRHRREGLAWRLARRAAAGQWAPRKRVAPADVLTRQRARIYALRQDLMETSHAAFAEARAAGDLSVFMARMAPVLAAYRRATLPPLRQRLKNRLRRGLNRIVPSGARKKLKSALGR